MIYIKKKALVFSFIFMVTCMLQACQGSIDLPPAPTYTGVRTMKIHLADKKQTIEGFGASDAWRCQMVGKYWPEEKKNVIADLLFSKELDVDGSPKGIGLSIWRFYLGSGSMEQGESSNIYDEWRRGECFQRQDGTYDWQKQEGQRWFLQAAKKRGVDKYLAFTISPPVHMTINGKAFSSQKREMNIKDGMMPEYANFLVDCIDNLQKQEGIKFDYLSPVNEPQWDWLAGDNGKASQEGTPATNEELYELTSLLSEQLSKRGLSTEIVLGEAGSIDYLYEKKNNESRDNQIEAFFNTSSALNVASLPNVKKTISGHSYFTVWPIEDQISHRQKLNAKLKSNQNLSYWQTEYCILENPGESEIPGGSGNQRDLGIKTAIFVARIIHNDLVVANASSWQWWTALTRADYKDGLIYLDDGTNNGGQSPDYCKKDGNFHASKLMWALGNYSFFVRPGMKRVEVDDTNHIASSTDVMISAYTDVSSKKVVIVAVNAGNKDRNYKLDIDANIKNKKLTPYITSSVFSLEKREDMDSENIVFPAQSIITLVGEIE